MSVVDIATGIVKVIYTVKNETKKMENTTQLCQTISSRLDMLLPAVNRLAESSDGDKLVSSTHLLVEAKGVVDKIHDKVIKYNKRSLTKRIWHRNKDAEDFQDLETQLEILIKDLHFDVSVSAEAQRRDDMKEMKSLIEKMADEIRATREAHSEFHTQFDFDDSHRHHRRKTPKSEDDCHGSGSGSRSGADAIINTTKYCGHSIGCILAEAPPPPSPFFGAGAGAFLLAASYDSYRTRSQEKHCLGKLRWRKSKNKESQNDDLSPAPRHSVKFIREAEHEIHTVEDAIEFLLNQEKITSHEDAVAALMNSFCRLCEENFEVGEKDNESGGSYNAESRRVECKDNRLKFMMWSRASSSSSSSSSSTALITTSPDDGKMPSNLHESASTTPSQLPPPPPPPPPPHPPTPTNVPLELFTKDEHLAALISVLKNHLLTSEIIMERGLRFINALAADERVSVQSTRFGNVGICEFVTEVLIAHGFGDSSSSLKIVELALKSISSLSVDSVENRNRFSAAEAPELSIMMLTKYVDKVAIGSSNESKDCAEDEEDKEEGGEGEEEGGGVSLPHPHPHFTSNANIARCVCDCILNLCKDQHSSESFRRYHSLHTEQILRSLIIENPSFSSDQGLKAIAEETVSRLITYELHNNKKKVQKPDMYGCGCSLA